MNIKQKKGKEVYFCIVHDSRAYNKNGTATIKLCKKVIDRASNGEDIKLLLGKGILIGLKPYSTETYAILVKEIYFAQKKNPIVKIGEVTRLHSIWINIGNYAKKKLLIFNPSRRKLVLKKYVREND